MSLMVSQKEKVEIFLEYLKCYVVYFHLEEKLQFELAQCHVILPIFQSGCSY